MIGQWFQGFGQAVQGGWIWFWQMGGWQPTLATALVVAGAAATIAGGVKTVLRWRKRPAVPVVIEHPVPLSEEEKQALLAWMQEHPDLEEVSEESEEQS